LDRGDGKKGAQVRIAGLRDTASKVWGALRRDPVVTTACVLAGVLAVSALLYAFVGTRQVRRVLFYPDLGTQKLVGEVHYVPRARGVEQSARALVKELLLGPAAYELGRVAPARVDLRALSVSDRVAYVDFSADLVLDAGEVPLSLGGIVQAVANNLYFNFPRLRGVYVLIHGQVPALEGMDAMRLAYSRDFVR
jgi:hypothetical protein